MIIPSSRLWPAPGVPVQNHYGFLAGKLGAPFPLVRPYLIGLRGVGLFATETHDVRTNPTYDDAFVLLAPGQEPKTFRGATHPYQTRSNDAIDVNGDRVPDVAMIDPGTYLLTFAMRDAAHCPVFKLTLLDGDQHIPCLRDTRHDGNPIAPSKATAILFHTGLDRPPGAAHSSSIGCQTTSLPNLNLMAKAGNVIDYRLIDAPAAVALMADFDPALVPEAPAENIA